MRQGQTPSASLKFLNSIMGDLRGQAMGLIAPLGGVGQGFIQLGPAGFVAATAIGVVVAAFSAASEKAAEFAEKSHALKEAAETAGLTITQFKLLSQQGVKVGLDSEQSAQFVNRLTVSIQELRSKGAGPLFDALLKIDAGLVREVASAKEPPRRLTSCRRPSSAWTTSSSGMNSSPSSAASAIWMRVSARAVGGAGG